MVSIDECLDAIKCDPMDVLDGNQIIELCREFDYWPEADGKLDPATLIALFMQQIASGNVSCDATRLIGRDAFSASAYCQARMRLPVGVIQTLARQSYQKISDLIDDEDQHRWHGHRVLLIDATSFSMPDTGALQDYFGQPGQQKKGCGFPVAHLLMLFNARTGLAVDAITGPLRTHEMSLASGTHQHMAPGDLVLGDDSFGSYAPRIIYGSSISRRIGRASNRRKWPRRSMPKDCHARVGSNHWGRTIRLWSGSSRRKGRTG